MERSAIPACEVPGQEAGQRKVKTSILNFGTRAEFIAAIHAIRLPMPGLRYASSQPCISPVQGISYPLTPAVA